MVVVKALLCVGMFSPGCLAMVQSARSQRRAHTFQASRSFFFVRLRQVRTLCCLR